MPGSSYCAEHRALCVLDPSSAAGLEQRRELDRAARAKPPASPLIQAIAAPEIEEGEPAIEMFRPRPATRDEEDEE